MDLKQYFYESAEVKKKFIDENEKLFLDISDLIVNKIKEWKKILVAWNWWSAADSQHFVAELMWRYKKERRSLPAVALSTDTSIITAVWNDYSYDDIFSKQVQWLGNEWDVFIWISTSGNSWNIIKAVDMAKTKKMISIWLLWKWGWKLKEMFDYSLIVPSDNTPRIQECHETIYHTICEVIDENF